MSWSHNDIVLSAVQADASRTLDIHGSFDKRGGIAQGRRVVDHVYDHAFLAKR
jgi:hypothetical protein